MFLFHWETFTSSTYLVLLFSNLQQARNKPKTDIGLPKGEIPKKKEKKEKTKHWFHLHLILIVREPFVALYLLFRGLWHQKKVLWDDLGVAQCNSIPAAEARVTHETVEYVRSLRTFPGGSRQILYRLFHVSLSHDFWRYCFYSLSFQAETYTMCVNVFYGLGNEISLGSDKKWEFPP